MKRFEHGRVQAADEIAHGALALFVRVLAGRRMRRAAKERDREQHATGPLQQALHNVLSDRSGSTASDGITLATVILFAAAPYR